MVKMILCMDLKGNIGRGNDLIFKMKEDMKFFKEQTMDNVVIMGFNTWVSIGEKPLPNRMNIVMTTETINNALTSADLKGAIEYCKGLPYEDVFIIGGANIYKQVMKLDLVDEVLVTVVKTEVEDATVRINMNLFEEFIEQFQIKEEIKTFENEEGLEVTIYSMRKE